MASWTRDAVLTASDDWVWVPPGAERLDIAGVDVIDYPDWARMGFYVPPRVVTGAVHELVDAVKRCALERGRDGSSWWITPTTTPPSLERSLVQHGAELTEVTDLLTFDMSTNVLDPGPTKDVHAYVVHDAETLEEAERISAAVWGGEPSSGERRAQQLRDLGCPLDSEGGFRAVSTCGTRPIATGGCQVVTDVARLYGACSLPDARGLGGYRELLRKRMEVARDDGATLALVHARVNTSGPILRRLGFESFGQARLFTLPSSPPPRIS